MGGVANSLLQLFPIYEKIDNLKISLITKYSEYKPVSVRMKIYTFQRFVKSKINTFYFFIKSFFKIYKINKKSPLHIINVHSFYFDIITPLLLRLLYKIPLLIKAPTDFETQQREIFMRQHSSLFSRVIYYSWINFFRKFVVKKKKIYYQAINSKIYNSLLELGVSKKNILKLPNAIHTEKFLDFNKTASKEKRYGYVGRLFKSKNIEFLLNVFTQYLSKYPNDKLHIFGEGDEQESITKFINERNFSKNIILHGFEKDKRKIYSNIDVLVHPTFGEGSPNTILESSVTNTFIIASNVTGIRDIITHGKSGLLFNPFKEEDLLKQLIYYKQHQDLVPNILKSAKNNIIENYEVNIIGYKLYNYIQSKWKFERIRKQLSITIITPVFPYPNRGILPGIERYVESLVFPLKEIGVNVKILTTFWNGGIRNDLYKKIPILRIKDSKTLFGKIGTLFHINYLTFGLNLIRKKNYSFFKDSDILIMPLAIGFTSLIKLKKIPIISCFLHYDKILSLVEHFNTPFYRLMEKKQFQKQKNIITVSNGSKNDIIKYYGIPQENIKVFPIGVDLNRFNPSRSQIDIRQKYGKTILLYSGPMIPRKRISILLFAMKKVIKFFPDVKLLLLGKGLYLKKYQKLGKNLKIEKNLVWVGFVENPEVYYASCDLFVFPSELEGFGQVITESMACGTPVICADKPPMCEIIGEGGVTFKLNNPNDLAEKIIILLSNRQELKRLSEKALNRVKEFEWLKVISDILEYAKKSSKIPLLSIQKA